MFATLVFYHFSFEKSSFLCYNIICHYIIGCKRKDTNMSHPEKIYFEASPVDIIDYLMNRWSINSSKYKSTLLLGRKVLELLKVHSLSYYDEYCVTAIMRECIIIGSCYPMNGRTYIVLDEVIQTYPTHKILYSREETCSDKVYIACIQSAQKDSSKK